MKPLQVLNADGSVAYSEAAVRDALHASVRSVRFKYQLLTSANAHKDWITNFVLAGSVANNALADINRTARFSMRDPGTVNWLSDRIKPWFSLKMPDNGYAEWPLGIFLLASPLKSIGSTATITREIEAYDQNLILMDDKYGDRYRVAAATNVITAVIAVLNGAGINQINYTPTAETLPVDREWEPGTVKKKIVGDLLSMINYRALYFNSAGYAVLEPYVAPSARPDEYTYSAQAAANGVMVPQVSQKFDLFSMPNKWTRIVSEPDRVALSSTYTNANAASPTSTVSRGRTIHDFASQTEATSQAALDAIVQRLAFEASQVYETIDFETALMPHHEDADLLVLDHPDIGKQKYVEHTWGMTLKSGEKMSHSIRRVVVV